MADFPAFFAALDAAPFAVRRAFVADPGWTRAKDNHHLFKAGSVWYLIAEKEGMRRAVRIASFTGLPEIEAMLQSFDA